MSSILSYSGRVVIVTGAGGGMYIIILCFNINNKYNIPQDPSRD